MLKLLLSVTMPNKNLLGKFSEEDFLYSKYLKCVLVHGCQVVQDVVRAIYGRRCMRTRNGTMSIRDFNIRGNVDPYFGGMACFLDANIMEDNFDISFGYKLLKEEHICGGVYNKFSEVSKNQMNYIITQRNKVCHNFGRSTDCSVQVDKLKTCITGIYQEASEKLKVGFDSNVKCVIEKIDGTMNAKATEALGKNCLEGLQEFKESLRYKMLSLGKDELFDYYKTLKTLSPCSWIDECNYAEMFNIEKIFTAPKIWVNKKDVDICMKDLLEFKLKTKTVPNILYIGGLAGSGKTSLCRYIAHSWYKKTGTINSLDCFDLVILIEIRRSSSVTLIEYLCEELLSDTCYEFHHGDIISLMQELDLLFIIDGFDENPTKGGPLMQDILNNFQNKRIIVTSRLNYETEIGNITEEFRLQPLTLPLTLEGFEESEQKVFSEKVFSIVGRSCDGFLKYLNGRGRVLSKHLKLPLTTSLLIVLWMEKPEVVNKITTATSLYYEIFTLYQEKLKERLIANLRARQLEALERKIPSLLFFLGEEAWFILLQGNGFCELSDSLRKTLEDKCEQRGIDASEFLSAFLMCEIHHSKLKSSNSKRLNDNYQYSFIHRTQMEYLAADFLAEAIKTRSLTLCEIDKKVSDWRNHSEVLVYLIGNMAKKNILKANELDFLVLAEKTGAGSTHFLYWWKIISESHITADIPDSPDEPIYYRNIRHPELAKAIYEKHLSRNTVWDLDDKEVAAGLRLMSLLSPICLTATTLSIKIPHGVDPVNIPDFYDALSAVEYHWKEKKKQKKIKIELHLNHHNSTSSNGSTSEQFLLLLKKWAELQNFTGSLKEVTNSLAEGYLKNVNCLITEHCALKSFENLPSSVRRLRLTLGFPPDTCTFEDLPGINFSGKLELSIPDMRDEYLNWLIKVIRKLSNNDLERLHLKHSKLTYNSIMDLVKSMNGILKGTLYITQPNFRNRIQEEKVLEEKARFSIEWME